MLNLFTGWRGFLIVAAVTAGATFWFTSLSYRLTISHMQSEQANAALVAANTALKQFSDDAGAIHDAAQSFGGISDNLNDQLTIISRNFKSAIKANPLPADCKPDAVRLRALSSAIAAANSAAGFQPVPAVPGHP